MFLMDAHNITRPQKCISTTSITDLDVTQHHSIDIKNGHRTNCNTQVYNADHLINANYSSVPNYRECTYAVPCTSQSRLVSDN